MNPTESMSVRPANRPAMRAACAQWLWGASSGLAVPGFLRIIALPVLVGLLAASGITGAKAAPPGGTLRHKPLKANDLPGESHVPGFPATPAKLTPEYIAAFMAAEADDPSESRMLHAFNHPDMGIPLVTYLPRYRSPLLIVPTRKLARGAHNPAVQAGAVGGLIGALDDTADTRLLVRGLLRSTHPVVRDRAAEYLRWFGGNADLPNLNRQAAAERDPHARAAMIEAAAAITRRVELFADGSSVLEDIDGPPAAGYRKCADALGAEATTGTRAAAIRLIRGAELCEPIHRYADRAGEPFVMPGASGEALAATVESVEDWRATLRLPDGSTRKVNRAASWVRGYLRPDDYRSPSNRWSEPQAFLRTFRR